MAAQKLGFPTFARPLRDHPASLPTANIGDDIDHRKVVSTTLQRLGSLKSSDLTKNVIWRDSLAFTGTLRTFFGPELVAQVWQERTKSNSLYDVEVKSSKVVRLGPTTTWIEGSFAFKTAGSQSARCSGTIGLVPAADDSSGSHGWTIWLLCTILDQLEGQPDVDDLQVYRGEQRSMERMPTNGSDSITTFDCIVIGAGLAGLCMAGRLEAMGLSYLVIEKDAAIAQNWVQERYQSLKLHTSTPFNQMPGSPPTFTANDPYLLKTADIAAGLQKYAETFGLSKNIRFSTLAESARYDSTAKDWTVTLQTGDGAERVKARHIVLAVGNNGVKPQMPSYPDRTKFKGDVLHGLHWRNASPWHGKRGIVVGAGNTAHGVIGDMASADFKSITMLQRSRTFLLPKSTFSALVDPVYNHDTPVHESDRMLLGYPLPIQRLMALEGIRMCAEHNTTYFDRIQAQGFDIERNGDLWGIMYDREGGHFFDTGSAELIANGSVQVRDGAPPVTYSERGLRLSDGSEIEADVIVFATGYTGNMKDTANRIFGNEVGNTLEEWWQCDLEGESRGAWKDVGHPGIWYTGHGFAHARYYSRFVAMHIKAEVEGKPLQVYTETPSVA